MHKEEETFNRALDLGVKVLCSRKCGRGYSARARPVMEDEHYLSPSISGYLVRRRGRNDAWREKPDSKT